MFRKILLVLIGISTMLTLSACQNTYNFTSLGADEAYEQFCGVLSSPAQHEGDTIIVRGELLIYESKQNNETCTAVIIKDEHGCCSTGVQFVLNDKKLSLIDNLVNGDEIIIKGKLNLYTENELLYCKLVNAELEPLAKGM